MPDLLVIVPTRSRPEAVQRVISAWIATDAPHDAQLLFAVDRDDPQYDAYSEAVENAPDWVYLEVLERWRPMVPKLNAVAVDMCREEIFAIGFAGDDHLPRTAGWAHRYVDTLRGLGTGIVYCDDGYQHERLPTQWAMTSDIVRALDRMVPAPVDHLYCDNAIMDLGIVAECIRYLPNVLIEHMHPVAGKAGSDEQYERVNGREQYRNDRAAYRHWRESQLAVDAATVRGLTARTEEKL